MYICTAHNWRSFYEQCPSCFPPTTVSASTQPIETQQEALLSFLDNNLNKSKEENPTMFMDGWIAALTHVKVNFLKINNT